VGEILSLRALEVLRQGERTLDPAVTVDDVLRNGRIFILAKREKKSHFDSFVRRFAHDHALNGRSRAVDVGVGGDEDGADDEDDESQAVVQLEDGVVRTRELYFGLGLDEGNDFFKHGKHDERGEFRARVLAFN